MPDLDTIEAARTTYITNKKINKIQISTQNKQMNKPTDHSTHTFKKINKKRKVLKKQKLSDNN